MHNNLNTFGKGHGDDGGGGGVLIKTGAFIEASFIQLIPFLDDIICLVRSAKQNQICLAKLSAQRAEAWHWQNGECLERAPPLTAIASQPSKISQ